MEPLLISVPTTELAPLAINGSVFEARTLLGSSISAELKRALTLIFEAFAAKYSNILCVARPEMFTHGESVAWLKARIHGANTHICLSDGRSVKTVPTLINGLFIYGLDQANNVEKFKSIRLRVPNLLDPFSFQINSCHAALGSVTTQPPETRIIGRQQVTAEDDLDWHYPLYLNRHSWEDSCERMMQSGECGLPEMQQYTRRVLALCTDTSMHDVVFCQKICRLIIEASRDQKMVLLLEMPNTPAVKGVAPRLAELLAGICRSQISIPRATLANVIVATHAKEQAVLNKMNSFVLVLHDSQNLWRYTTNFYKAASEISLSLSRPVIDTDKIKVSIAEKLLDQKPKVEKWTREAQILFSP